jgi:small-conductance mechanosensitive channel/CRP-like cAMP-binding protein
MADILRQVHIGWGGFFTTLGILVALLFVRRLLTADRRRRGRVALAFLALSIMLRLGAGGLLALQEEGSASVVSFLAILLESFGITGFVALVVFDISLARVRINVPSLVRDIVMGIALAIITIGVLQTAGVNLVGLITTSAVLTAVIGLALQSTISNLFAGLSLQVDRTIGVGDWVLVGGRTGRISEIKWRSTLLVTRDGDSVILPNAHMLSNEVVNYSKPTRNHRVTMKLGVHYRHPPNEVKRVLLEAARGVPGVLDEPAPDCFPSQFGDSAVVYSLRYWVDDVQREATIDGEIHTRAWYATQRAGIQIPYPIRDVFVHEITAEQAQREHEHEIEERANALAQTDLFGALDQADRQKLARSLTMVSFADGERIIRQGEPGDSLYLVRAGEVGVRLSVDGAEREVAVLRAGQFFGEMSLMTGEPRKATCSAKGDATCYVMQHGAFRRVIAAKPQIAEQISAVLGQRQSALEGERGNLSAEARARAAAENSSRLLARIRDFFNLG